MPDYCKGCIHWKKESQEVGTTGVIQNTWIDVKNPDDPTAEPHEIATCINPLTTMEIIVRDALTDWFFTQDKYLDIISGEIVVSGEQDSCEFFEPIV